MTACPDEKGTVYAPASIWIEVFCGLIVPTPEIVAVCLIRRRAFGAAAAAVLPLGAGRTVRVIVPLEGENETESKAPASNERRTPRGPMKTRRRTESAS